MLSRLLAARILSRGFSGGHDPYLLHLHQEPDKFPQYAHLHWHTVDPLEIGKYAKERSAAQFGDHVSEDPAPVEWFADLGDLITMDRGTRDTVYEGFLRFEDELIPFLEENIDYTDHHDHKLIVGAYETILHALEPEQIQHATEFAKKIIEEFKAAGVPVTRNCIQEKVNLYLLKNMTKHQVHDLHEGMMDYLEYFGTGIPLNEE